MLPETNTTEQTISQRWTLEQDQLLDSMHLEPERGITISTA